MKKLSVNRLALGNLKQRRKQYVLLVIGVILAMVFSSGSIFFKFSSEKTQQELDDRDFGKQEYIITNTAAYNMADFEKFPFIEKIGYFHDIGFVPYTSDEDSNGAYIAWGDETAKTISYMNILDGRMPEKAGEVAIEESTLVFLGINPEVGSEISLSVIPTNAGSLLGEAETEKYTLVGVLADKATNIVNYHGYNGRDVNIPSIFVAEGTNTRPGGKETLVAYMDVTLEKVFDEKFNEFLWSAEDGESLNYIDTVWMSTWSNERSAIVDKTSAAVFLCVILLISSAVGIINAFNTNLNDRKRQIGLLRAVGASKHQIVNIYGREALFIALASLPVSLVISFFAVKAICKLIYKDAILTFDITALVLSAVFSFACVMAAAIIPLLHAAKITPMQAVRNIEIIRKLRNKKVKSQKKYDPAKLIAKRSIVLSRGKRFLVSVILVVCILISCFGFALVRENLTSVWNPGYDYMIYSYGNYYDEMTNCQSKQLISENQRRDIMANPYVKSAPGSADFNMLLECDEYGSYLDIFSYNSYDFRFENDYERDITVENYKEIFHSRESDRYLALKEKLGTDKTLFNTVLMASDLSDIKTLNVLSGRIDIDKINAGEEVVLSASEEVGYYIKPYRGGGYMSSMVDMKNDTGYEKKKVLEKGKLPYKAGDVITIYMIYTPEIDYNVDASQFMDIETGLAKNMRIYKKQVRIGAVVEPKYTSFNFYTTPSGIAALGEKMTGYNNLNVNLKTECTDEIDNIVKSHIEKVMNRDGFENGYIESTFATKQSMLESAYRSLFEIIAVVAMAFVACASIINNSLTASIRESKKEIGTLRAVGATTRILTKNYVYQLLSLFGTGCLAGFIIYIVLWGSLTLLSRIDYFEILREFQIKFEIWEALVICVVLIIVCSINLWSKIRKMTKSGIVENIREL